MTNVPFQVTGVNTAVTIGAGVQVIPIPADRYPGAIKRETNVRIIVVAILVAV